MQAKTRIEELDMLKALGIIMVVVGHTNCPYELNRLFYFIHMPLFFMLSGCTNRPDSYYGERKNVRQFALKRLKTLYWPFLYYSIPIVLLHNVFASIGLYESVYDARGLLVQLIRVLLFSIGDTEPFLPQLWFIKVLFITEILYALAVMVAVKMRVNKYYLLLPLSVAALLVSPQMIPHLLFMNLFIPLRAMFYYLLGGISIKLIGKIAFNNKTLTLSGFILIGWLLSALHFHQTAITETQGAVSALQVIFLIAFVVVAWRSYKYVSRIGALRQLLLYLGRKTMPIYFLHYLVFALISGTFIFCKFHDIGYLDTKLFTPFIPWEVYTIGGIVFSLLIYYVFRISIQAISNTHK